MTFASAFLVGISYNVLVKGCNEIANLDIHDIRKLKLFHHIYEKGKQLHEVMKKKKKNLINEEVKKSWFPQNQFGCRGKQVGES